MVSDSISGSSRREVVAGMATGTPLSLAVRLLPKRRKNELRNDQPPMSWGDSSYGGSVREFDNA